MLLLMLFVAFLVVFVILVFWLRSRKSFFRSLLPTVTKTPPIQIRTPKIDFVNPYHSDKCLHDQYDIIYVGSGGSGLGGASILAQHGKRVLILEKGDQLGGLCHSFSEEGYEFCSGLHYLFDDPTFMHALYAKVSSGRIRLKALLGEDLDSFWGRLVTTVFDEIEDDPSECVVLKCPHNGGIEKMMEEEIRVFGKGDSELEDQIRQFYDDASHCKKEAAWLLILRHLVPRCLRGCLVWFLETFLKVRIFRLWKISYSEYLERTFPNSLVLRSLHSDLCSLFGYVDETAASAPLTATGLYPSTRCLYPVGGVREGFIRPILDTIAEFGGQAFTHAEVSEIVLDENDVAIGVRLSNGDFIRSSWVVTCCGVKNTYSMLPDRVHPTSLARFAKSSCHTNMAFLGFDVPVEDLNLPNSAIVISVLSSRAFDTYQKFAQDHRKEDEEDGGSASSDEFPPMTGVTFLHPNAVHPIGIGVNEGKAGAFLFLTTSYAYFKRWKNQRVKNRGSEYEDFKEQMWRRAIELFFRHYPHLRQHLVFESLSTPLSAAHWTNWPTGEVGGVVPGVGTRIFEMFDECVDQPGGVKGGLVVSGIDSMPWGGIPFAFLSGVTSSMKILRNPLLLLDLVLSK